MLSKQRRLSLYVITGVFTIAVLGTAAAFAYRTFTLGADPVLRKGVLCKPEAAHTDAHEIDWIALACEGKNYIVKEQGSITEILVFVFSEHVSRAKQYPLAGREELRCSLTRSKQAKDCRIVPVGWLTD